MGALERCAPRAGILFAGRAQLALTMCIHHIIELTLREEAYSAPTWQCWAARAALVFLNDHDIPICVRPVCRDILRTEEVIKVCAEGALRHGAGVFSNPGTSRLATGNSPQLRMCAAWVVTQVILTLLSQGGSQGEVGIQWLQILPCRCLERLGLGFRRRTAVPCIPPLHGV